MATVQCPTEIPVSHDHELLESKRHVPYVRCDGMGSHIYFKTDAAREWLAAHLVNGPGRGNYPVPSVRKTNPGPATEEVDDFRCERCARVDHKIVPLERGMTECPECHEPIEWPSEESDDHVDPDLGI